MIYIHVTRGPRFSSLFLIKKQKNCVTTLYIPREPHPQGVRKDPKKTWSKKTLFLMQEKKEPAWQCRRYFEHGKKLCFSLSAGPLRPAWLKGGVITPLQLTPLLFAIPKALRRFNKNYSDQNQFSAYREKTVPDPDPEAWHSLQDEGCSKPQKLS